MSQQLSSSPALFGDLSVVSSQLLRTNSPLCVSPRQGLLDIKASVNIARSPLTSGPRNRWIRGWDRSYTGDAPARSRQSSIPARRDSTAYASTVTRYAFVIFKLLTTSWDFVVSSYGVEHCRVVKCWTAETKNRNGRLPGVAGSCSGRWMEGALQRVDAESSRGSFQLGPVLLIVSRTVWYGSRGILYRARMGSERGAGRSSHGCTTSTVDIRQG